MRELNAGALVHILNEHDVRFIVIGGLAAQVHDLPIPATIDIDVTPANDHANLERLAAAQLTGPQRQSLMGAQFLNRSSMSRSG